MNTYHHPIITYLFLGLFFGTSLSLIPDAMAELNLLPVSETDAGNWIRHTVPLPKQIDIRSKVNLRLNDILVTCDNPSIPLIQQAARELQKSLGQYTVRPSTSITFTITLQLGGAFSQDLTYLKNSAQAYKIIPERQNSGLRLVALTPRGLYYASKTLQQLIRPNPATVDLPILEVTDSPDMEDRGLWGSDCHMHLEWLAERKMNIVEQISHLAVDTKGRGHSRGKSGRESMFTIGPRYGIKPVPVVLHLEQVSRKGVFEAYPQLKAKGGQEGAICYSQPAFIDILTDWIVDLKNLHGVDEVDVWMTENLHGKGGCRCNTCRKQNRNIQEAKVIMAAWKRAKDRIGDFSIRILTSEETEKDNEKVFKILDPSIKIWYYHSLYTYKSFRTHILRPYLAEFAAKGRWIGVCPALVSSLHYEPTFTCAHFVNFRMNEFVDKNLSGIIGFSTPRVDLNRFNTEAAAEWSWNAKGRSPREFALSWAIRQEMKDPEKFAEWSETVGPVAWDIYGSDFPAGEKRNVCGNIASRLAAGKVPELGKSLWGVYPFPWGDINSAEQLEIDVIRAKKGLTIARQMGIPEYIYESTVVEGYISALDALWDLQHIVTPEGIAREDKSAAGRSFKIYIDKLKQAKEALLKWDESMTKGPDGRLSKKAVEVVDELMAEMKRVAESLGYRIGPG